MLGSDQSSAAILGPASLRAEAEFAVTGTGRLADRVWFESSTMFLWLSGAGDGYRALARAVSQRVVGLTRAFRSSKKRLLRSVALPERIARTTSSVGLAGRPSELIGCGPAHERVTAACNTEENPSSQLTIRIVRL